MLVGATDRHLMVHVINTVKRNFSMSIHFITVDGGTMNYVTSIY